MMQAGGQVGWIPSLLFPRIFSPHPLLSWFELRLIRFFFSLLGQKRIHNYVWDDDRSRENQDSLKLDPKAKVSVTGTPINPTIHTVVPPTKCRPLNFKSFIAQKKVDLKMCLLGNLRLWIHSCNIGSQNSKNSKKQLFLAKLGEYHVFFSAWSYRSYDMIYLRKNQTYFNSPYVTVYNRRFFASTFWK